MTEFIAGGTFGKVFRCGGVAVKVYNEPPPAHFAARVLPALAPCILAAECALDAGGALHMPLWGPTLWDVYGAASPPPEVAEGLRQCLIEQLNTLVSLGFAHADVKPANIAFTGGWPHTGAAPVELHGRNADSLATARCAGLDCAGFVLIDLDAVCPLDSWPLSDRGSLDPYGAPLEPMVKTPYLACYAMWFAASATLEGYTPVTQVSGRAEFAAQHEQLEHWGLLPPLADTLSELDRVGYFDALAIVLSGD